MMGYTTTRRRKSHGTLENSVYTIGSSAPFDQFREVYDPRERNSFLFETVTSYRSDKAQGGKALTNQEILDQAGVGSNAFLMPYDTGHPFDHEIVKFLPRNSKIRTFHGLGNQGQPLKVTGPCYLTAFMPVGDGVSLPFPEVVDTTSWGAKAINLTVPTKPVISIAEFLAQFASHQELPDVGGSEGFGGRAFNDFLSLFQGNTLKEITRNFLSKGGRSWLNLEYGWVPFISDLQSAIKAVTASQDVVKQLVRDSGRPVRRKYRFPTMNTVTTLADNLNCNDLGSKEYVSMSAGGRIYSNFIPTGYVTATDSYTREMWFSGEYIYHLPDGDSLLAKFERYTALAQKLTGFEITPIALWDLAPWSWLADWFGDFSTVISNATLFSDPNTNLVLRYGYLMVKQTMRRNVVAVGFSLDTGFTGNLSASYVHERKQRVKATPYGFGFNMDLLSPYQISILAALGVSTRAKR